MCVGEYIFIIYMFSIYLEKEIKRSIVIERELVKNLCIKLIFYMWKWKGEGFFKIFYMKC